MSFSGRVESVSSSALAARDVHADPNSGYYPTLVVAGRTVRTNAQTSFRWSDGSTLDPRAIKAGQTAYVEGWKKSDGSVRATGFRVDGSASPEASAGAAGYTRRLPKPEAPSTMQRLSSLFAWLAVAAAGGSALAAIAFSRGEPVNGVFFVVAAGGTYLVAYRFYSAFIAAKVLALDATRATPAERLDDGRDFVPTNRWIVLGHHFAAIAGPGPLVGPTLAAQFGYLPGHALADRGCRARRLRAGLRDPRLLAAPRRPLARADGARGGEPARRA